MLHTLHRLFRELISFRQAKRTRTLMQNTERTPREGQAGGRGRSSGRSPVRAWRSRITDPSNRMLVLLLSLLLLILIYPFLQRSWLPGLVLLVVILAAVAEVSDQRMVFRWAVVLGTPAFVILGLNIVGIEALGVPSLVLTVVFFVYILVVLFRHILRSRVVEAEVLYGAIACYLLISYVWAFLYQILYILDPGAFSYGAHEALTFFDFLYYSFITITTVGYGDLTPATDHAKSLAVVEAIVGMFYTALVIARLVDLYSAQTRTTS